MNISSPSKNNRKFMEIDMNKMSEEDKEYTRKFLLKQKNEIFFDPKQSKNGEYVAHIQILNDDKGVRSNLQTPDKVKNREKAFKKNVIDENNNKFKATGQIENKALSEKYDGIIKY